MYQKISIPIELPNFKNCKFISSDRQPPSWRPKYYVGTYRLYWRFKSTLVTIFIVIILYTAIRANRSNSGITNFFHSSLLYAMSNWARSWSIFSSFSMESLHLVLDLPRGLPLISIPRNYIPTYLCNAHDDGVWSVCYCVRTISL